MTNNAIRAAVRTIIVLSAEFSLRTVVCLDVHCEMTADLRRVLNEDVSLLQQQLESVELDQLYTQLRSSVDYIEETQPRHHTLAIPTFSDGYNSFG